MEEHRKSTPNWFWFVIGWGIGAIMICLLVISGLLDPGNGRPNRGFLPNGEYTILAVVERTDDHVLLVLRESGNLSSEPNFRKVEAEDTINFETTCCHTGDTVVRVDTNDLTYIKFVPSKHKR